MCMIYNVYRKENVYILHRCASCDLCVHIIFAFRFAFVSFCCCFLFLCECVFTMDFIINGHSSVKIAGISV